MYGCDYILWLPLWARLRIVATMLTMITTSALPPMLISHLHLPLLVVALQLLVREQRPIQLLADSCLIHPRPDEHDLLHASSGMRRQDVPWLNHCLALQRVSCISDPFLRCKGTVLRKAQK